MVTDLPPTTNHQIHRCQGARVPNHQKPPTTRPTRHPGHMVTGLPLATLPPIIRCQGAKVPRCQSHHHQNIGLPDTISTDSPNHRSHRPTRLTGARATSHRVTDPPLTTRHRATIHTDHQLPRSHGHQPLTTLSTEPPSHQPTRPSEPQMPMVSKPPSSKNQ